MSKASSVGGRFIATGGAPLDSDDQLISLERDAHELTAKSSEKKKKNHDAAKKREANAKTVLDKCAGENWDVMDKVHAGNMLQSELSDLHEWKHGSEPQKKEALKAKLLADWMITKELPLADAGLHPWTLIDDIDLVRLRTEVITLADTDGGRQVQSSIDTAVSALSHISKEQRQALIKTTGEASSPSSQS